MLELILHLLHHEFTVLLCRPFAAFDWTFSMRLAVICCVYVTADSYLSVHAHPSMEVHELLRIVALKMDRAEEEMVLAVMSHTGGTDTVHRCLSEVTHPRNPCSYSLALNYHLYLSLLSFLYTCASPERRVLQPSDCVYSESLTPQAKLMACRRDLTEILVWK